MQGQVADPERAAHDRRRRHDAPDAFVKTRIEFRGQPEATCAIGQQGKHRPSRQCRRDGRGNPADHGAEADGQYHVHHHCHHGKVERAAGVFTRVVKRLQDLLQHEGRQAEPVDRHRNGDGRGVICGCGPALEQHRGQREGDHHQRNRRGDGQRQRHLGGAADLGVRSLFVSGLEPS